MSEIKVESFSTVVESKDESATRNFFKVVEGFCQRFNCVEKPSYQQSSCVVDGIMKTHLTAVVRYKKNS